VIIVLFRLWFPDPRLIAAVDRVQGEPEVADLGEHAVQRPSGVVALQKSGGGSLVIQIWSPGATTSC
jgi:hypothetical protein